MTFDTYILPDGERVKVDASAAKGATVIDFTLKGGSIVPARLDLDEHFARLKAEQKHDPSNVADGLIGIAQGLEKLARRMREAAGQVRRGEYLADFAHATGRDVRYKVEELVNGELPEGI